MCHCVGIHALETVHTGLVEAPRGLDEFRPNGRFKFKKYRMNNAEPCYCQPAGALLKTMIDCLRRLLRLVTCPAGAAAWMLVALSAGAGAQTSPPHAAAPAPVASVSAASMASRVLACTACHGKEGRATQEGYFPRIAGKPAGYLANQLLNFREGRRSYPQMTYLLEHLTDDYLREMAAHFAALELPYSPPPAPHRARSSTGCTTR